MSIRLEIAELQHMSMGQLRAKYAEVFGQATRSGHKELLFRKIAWRLQARAEGDLSEQARRRAMELANDLDIRTRVPAEVLTAIAPERTSTEVLENHSRLPSIGTKLQRQYKGRVVQVTVLRDGFEFKGETNRSLSAIAKQVTGTHWNGYHFFGLAPKKGTKK